MGADQEKNVSQSVIAEEPGVVSSSGGDFVEDEREGAWIRFMTIVHWYPKSMPSLEKKLILKLDLMILIFGCLSFFTKYLDQQSITNAYVS